MSPLNPLQMVHRMVAPAVTTALDFLKQFGMTAHVIAHEEECGLYAIVVEQVKNPWSNLRDGAVVESQINSAPFLAFDAPYGLGKEDTVQQRRLLDEARRLETEILATFHLHDMELSFVVIAVVTVEIDTLSSQFLYSLLGIGSERYI